MRKVINQKRVRTWEAMGGACCFVAGIVAPVLGLLLTAMGWIVEAELRPWLHAAATALFVVSIPLILLAGFFLDWAERRRKEPLPDLEQSQRGPKSPQIAIIATLLGVALLAPATPHAQRHTFNVPGTNVLDRGKALLQAGSERHGGPIAFRTAKPLLPAPVG